MGTATDLRTAIWLRTRLLVGRRRRLTIGVAASVWILLSAALITGAALVYSRSPLPAGTVTVLLLPLWLLWAFLPALGGGGDLDSLAHTAPHPIRPWFAAGGTMFGTLVDIQYLVGAPALAAAGITAWGPRSLLATAVFMIGAAGAGQLTSWATSLAGPRKAVPATLAAGALAAGLAGLAIALGGWTAPAGPGAWYVDMVDFLGDGRLWWAAGVGALLLAPAAVWLLVADRLVAAALVARTNVATAHRRSIGWPRGRAGAVVTAHLMSIARSLTGRVTAITAVIIPLVTLLGIGVVHTEQVVAITALAAGTTTAINAYSYDAGGTLLLMSAPMRSRALIAVRMLASGLWIFAIVCVSVAVSFAVGTTPRYGAGELVWVMVAATAICVAAGLRGTTVTPADVDHSSLRARPATVTATAVYAGFAAGGIIAVGSIASPTIGWGSQAGLAAILAVLIVAAATRATFALRDGSRMAAAFN